VLARNMSVTFHTDVYKTKPWFHIPKSVARLLSVKSGDVLAVGISKPDGELIYHGLAKMDSRTEMLHIGKILRRGDEIRVTVSHPPSDTVVQRRKAERD
jgi:hypothetical protein